MLEEQTTDSAVRRNNRVLRRLNRVLRSRVEKGKSYADNLFLQICASTPLAEMAIWRLWKEGGFESSCSPEDYQEIVDTSIRALKAYREEAEKPSSCNHADRCKVPPLGWRCLREAGHEGPCAAIPDHYIEDPLESSQT